MRSGARALARWIDSSIHAVSLTSPTKALAVPPAAVISSTTDAAASALMSVTSTLAPLAARVCATARPIPDPAPVTIAERSATSYTAMSIPFLIRRDRDEAAPADGGGAGAPAVGQPERLSLFDNCRRPSCIPGQSDWALLMRLPQDRRGHPHAPPPPRNVTTRIPRAPSGGIHKSPLLIPQPGGGSSLSWRELAALFRWGAQPGDDVEPTSRSSSISHGSPAMRGGFEVIRVNAVTHGVAYPGGSVDARALSSLGPGVVWVKGPIGRSGGVLPRNGCVNDLRSPSPRAVMPASVKRTPVHWAPVAVENGSS